VVSGARQSDKGKDILRRISLPRGGRERPWRGLNGGESDASKVELDGTKSLIDLVRGGIVGCALLRIQSRSILRGGNSIRPTIILIVLGSEGCHRGVGWHSSKFDRLAPV
jgi:hypothetical protein